MKCLWMQFLTFFLHLQNPWALILHQSLLTYLSLWWNLGCITSWSFWPVSFHLVPRLVLDSYHFDGWKVQKASRPLQDRTMVVACLAEVAQDMGGPIAGYVDVILLQCETFFIQLLVIWKFWYFVWKLVLCFRGWCPWQSKNLLHQMQLTGGMLHFVLENCAKMAGSQLWSILMHAWPHKLTHSCSFIYVSIIDSYEFYFL